MTHSKQKHCRSVIACGLILLSTSVAVAQDPVDYTWQNAEVGDWAATGLEYNWDDPLGLGGSPLPTGSFGERAIINNGGTAVVSSTVDQPGDVIVAGNSTLRIANNGNLTTDDSDPLSNGRVIVGQNNVSGTLRVESGGTLNATAFDLFAPGSALVLSGSASVSLDLFANLNRRYRVVGPDVDFSSGGLSASANSLFQPVITATTHSTLQINGSAELDGTVQADFSGFPTAALGDTWNLIEANSVNGEYDSVTATGLSLPAGQRLTVQQVPNGATTLVQLAIEQRLYAEVNSHTGTVEIKSSDTTPIAIDGYTISSPSQTLDPADGAWNSLFDQNTPNWIEANPTSSRLTEAQIDGSTGVSSGAMLSLGAAYSPTPAEFGTSIRDLEFTYFTPTGEEISGDVIYTGVSNVNNLALIVDPATGEAQLKNSSGFSVAIDGYQISTDGGTFDQTGWNSLSEQAVDGWVEANPTAKQLTEADINDPTALSAGAAFNLGDLFAGMVSQDLEFRYLLAGQSTLTNGIVLYDSLPALPTGLPGDYNDDGTVDAADYTVWRDNLGGNESALNGNGNGSGTVDEGDYSRWRSNFGATALASAGNNASAVPEPGNLILAIIGLVMFSVRRKS